MSTGQVGQARRARLAQGGWSSRGGHMATFLARPQPTHTAADDDLNTRRPGCGTKDGARHIGRFPTPDTAPAHAPRVSLRDDLRALHSSSRNSATASSTAVLAGPVTLRRSRLPVASTHTHPAAHRSCPLSPRISSLHTAPTMTMASTRPGRKFTLPPRNR